MTNILVILLQILLGLLVLLMPTLAAVFLSIDCGSSDSFTDANNITWVGDETYIKSGKSESVPSAVNSSIARQYTTRRVFPTGKKNCYSIQVGKGERVLLRAHFYYGIKTDETSTAPQFDLQFDGNPWASVYNISSGLPFYKEVMYLTKFEAISVCVSRNVFNPDDVSFISTIEIRNLDLGMYGKLGATYPLFTRRRTNQGGDKNVRFPDDKYDRVWEPGDIYDRFALRYAGSTELVANYSEVIIADLPNKPPKSVLQTEIKSSNSSDPGIAIWIVDYEDIGEDEITLYSVFYFLELEQLNSSEQRSFWIYLNGGNITNPITPPYGTALEIDLTTNISYSANKMGTSYDLLPPSGSTLLPMVNAVEIFQIGNALEASGTNGTHVKVLSLLQKTFVQLQDWSGDPCLPNDFPWDWIQCTFGSRETAPQVTALYLGNYGLQGSLPDISPLDTLQLIDLNNNSLSGEIPRYLANFPNLNMLNLANNNFSGLIPSPLTNKSNLTLVYSGNPNLLCPPNRSSCDISGNGTSILLPSTNSQSNISKNFLVTIVIVILVSVLVSY
ncbi:PREDICTED: probable LRR receptor-like serine/threonine-protein kinase At5g59680 [Nelumbo nucifera]|uniref:Malectin-like domain-containing protein n=2 Tax=Nelumbo nucifera TaxID=4432 RepID=A0A822ZHQ9_NELNU|nr:PREDICTED: probable LRR receptor-like serine/threonine-protein kinase At5g59680 [Nelumbo nucifera]DAD42576.1 TPA_asm: hypothetical protein HUJ06_000806 [Nelumbo nucifera]